MDDSLPAAPTVAPCQDEGLAVLFKRNAELTAAVEDDTSVNNDTSILPAEPKGKSKGRRKTAGEGSVSLNLGAQKVLSNFMKNMMADVKVDTGTATAARMWEDSMSTFEVDGLSLKALRELPEAERVLHAETIVASLDGDGKSKRFRTALELLGEMPPEVKARFAVSIAEKLRDSWFGVRRAALHAFSNMPVSTRAAHATAILRLREDPEAEVRKLVDITLTAEVLREAICHSIIRNDFVEVFTICSLLPANHPCRVDAEQELEEHAAEERRMMLEDAGTIIIVLSTRYSAPKAATVEESLEELHGMSPLRCSDLVKDYIEANGPNIRVFNPNRDNAALQRGDPEKANGIWLRTWRTMLIRALDTGGCVLRLDLEEAGMSDMQEAETDMAADKGVPLISMSFSRTTTEQELRERLNACEASLIGNMGARRKALHVLRGRVMELEARYAQLNGGEKEGASLSLPAAAIRLEADAERGPCPVCGGRRGGGPQPDAAETEKLENDCSESNT